MQIGQRARDLAGLLVCQGANEEQLHRAVSQLALLGGLDRAIQRLRRRLSAIACSK